MRLAGIDAPEKKQPYGAQARRHLVALVFGKPVVVTLAQARPLRPAGGSGGAAPVPGACGRPDCARLEDVGLAQVESGLAWHYRQYQNEQSPEDRRRYTLAEQEARCETRGLVAGRAPGAAVGIPQRARAAASALRVMR